jgi:hypothetical protein
VFRFIINYERVSSLGLPACTRHGHRNRVTDTRGRIDTVCLAWWWAQCARNMYRVKINTKTIVRHVGHLPIITRCTVNKTLKVPWESR